MSAAAADWSKDRVNREIRYHSEISLALTSQRTALESALIPVTAYILVACVECYRRYPEMIEAIAGASPPEDLGRAGHRFATQIDNVHLWALPNFTLIGRKVLATAGMVDWAEDERRMGIVFDFWDRAARAYRFDDDSRQAWDAGGEATPYRDHVPALLAHCRPVDDGRLARVTRLNALLTSYLFLLWFDTRSGYQDTGPYRLADGRVLLLRAFNGLGPSHFPWSAAVASDMPHHDVLAAFVLDGVDFEVTDFGTSVTHPEDYLSHVVEFALFDVSSGVPEPIDDDGLDALAAAAKAAQRQLYRTIAGMERRAKIDAGAYVYFSFLRPFAELAGADLDWTVPRDSVDLYPLLELIEGGAPGGMDEETVETYYSVIPQANAVDPADERAHDPGAASWWETWHLDAATDAGVGISLRLACAPALGVAWWWTHLLLPDVAGPVVVRDHEVGLPRQGLEVRADGLWGELTCEAPFEHWTYGLEAFGVRLDDPADSFRGEIGERMAVGLDIEWEVESAGDAPYEHRGDPALPAYEQFGRVHGEVLLERSRWEIDAVGLRSHTWGTPAFDRPADELWARGTGVDVSFTASADHVDGRVAFGVEAEEISTVHTETRRRADGLPVAARHVVNDRFEIEAEMLGLVAIPIPVANGEMAVLARGLCRYEIDDRTAVGWSSRLDP